MATRRAKSSPIFRHLIALLETNEAGSRMQVDQLDAWPVAFDGLGTFECKVPDFQSGCRITEAVDGCGPVADFLIVQISRRCCPWKAASRSRNNISPAGLRSPRRRRLLNTPRSVCNARRGKP